MGDTEPINEPMIVPDTTFFLNTAAGCVSGPRLANYGPVGESFDRTAALWSTILGIEVTAAQVAMCQVALKISRLVEMPNHTDGWVDICGYGAIGGEVSHRPQHQH